MPAPKRRTFLAGAALAACLAAPATATASPEPPLDLPGGAAAAASLPADPSTWIVGARPGAAARTLAHRFGARRVGPDGTGGYVVARDRARRFAGALQRRGLLVYAQANTLSERAQATDPLTVPPDAWRAQVVAAGTVPPPVTTDSPLIALVDSAADLTHPEFAGGQTATLPGVPLTDGHGTATASVAAAPVNGVGIVGVWPGARALNVPLPARITCRDSANRIAAALQAGAGVINMSYGSRGLCYPEYVALQFAVARGSIPVAAAGNEFAEGNPLEYPASLPHVLTVAAVGPDRSSSYFSNTSAAIDLSAPGEAIMTAVPLLADDDGTADGYLRQSGTSFAAPMVAAAVAWVRQARPDLAPDQVAQAVRLGATDIGRPGWQPDTGFGLLSVSRALTVQAPPRDPSEPNDDIVWVDGRAFETPDRLFYGGRGRARLFALLDVFEDPADVYRIRVRGNRRVRITADPSRGDNIALAVHRKGAKRIASRALRRSTRRGGRTEKITLRNRSRRGRVFYVSVRVQRGSNDLDAGYALRIR